MGRFRFSRTTSLDFKGGAPTAPRWQAHAHEAPSGLPGLPGASLAHSLRVQHVGDCQIAWVSYRTVLNRHRSLAPQSSIGRLSTTLAHGGILLSS